MSSHSKDCKSAHKEINKTKNQEFENELDWIEKSWNGTKAWLKFKDWKQDLNQKKVSKWLRRKLNGVQNEDWIKIETGLKSVWKIELKFKRLKLQEIDLKHF